MDAGVIALLFGLAAVGIIAAIPRDWMKAGGGLLILVTVILILISATQLLGR